MSSFSEVYAGGKDDTFIFWLWSFSYFHGPGIMFFHHDERTKSEKGMMKYDKV